MRHCAGRYSPVRTAAFCLALVATALAVVIPVLWPGDAGDAMIALGDLLPLVPVWCIVLLLFLWPDDSARRKGGCDRALTEHRFLDAIENLSQGIALYDADERFVVCNSRYRDMRSVVVDLLVSGVLFEDVLRASTERRLGLLKGVDAGNVEEWIAQRLQRFRNPGLPEERELSDGRWEEIQCFRTVAGDRLIIRSDITERKEAAKSQRLSAELATYKRTETAMQEAKAAAEAASRSKSQFLANISHEFRTPLNAIIGFADVLNRQSFGPLGDDRYREYTEFIATSGEHLLALVNDLLDLSLIEGGRQAPNREMLAPDEIVADGVRLFSAGEDVAAVDLNVDVPGGLPPVHGDRRMITRVLLNLLSNAVKFTPKGGRVTVTAAANDGYTELCIADTGRGIPKDKLKEVVSLFQKGEGDPYLAEQGWGLGLSVTQAIVTLHEGELEIRSHVGEGTSVFVRLPNRAA